MLPKIKSRQSGWLREQQARSYLEKQGLKWLCSNYFCPRGEIDLIMLDKDTLVFVEVRYRKVDGFGEGIETVRSFKQKRMIKAAWQFLLENHLVDKINARFDVIGISDDSPVNWIQNAIEVQY
jgi:putative endonuclease